MMYPQPTIQYCINNNKSVYLCTVEIIMQVKAV